VLDQNSPNSGLSKALTVTDYMSLGVQWQPIAIEQVDKGAVNASESVLAGVKNALRDYGDIAFN
jgi:hypothetical protein